MKFRKKMQLHMTRKRKWVARSKSFLMDEENTTKDRAVESQVGSAFATGDMKGNNCAFSLPYQTTRRRSLSRHVAPDKEVRKFP